MIGVALALAVITTLIDLGDAGPPSLLRHAYLLPVVTAGLRFGLPGGVLTAASAALLNAPFLLPEIERSGLTADAAEGLVTVGLLAVERRGEIFPQERAALEALGAHVGLALENARLASRQRQFAAELGEKVAAARRELEELDRAKTAFVAIASHELRTPLTSLQGFSELLAVRRLPPEEVTRLAGVMRTEAKRLGRIVSDLLDLSRIERGLAPALCRVPLALAPAIEATADLFRLGTATHPIEIECDPALPPVDADPAAVERVLTNLISTAIKYSPAGSTVRVKA